MKLHHVHSVSTGSPRVPLDPRPKRAQRGRRGTLRGRRLAPSAGLSWGSLVLVACAACPRLGAGEAPASTAPPSAAVTSPQPATSPSSGEAASAAAAPSKGKDDAFRRLAEAAAKDPALSPELKQAFAEAARELEQQEAEIEKVSTMAKILSKLKVFGDFRFRHETTWSVDGAEARNRERIRLRVGASYLILPSLEFGARLSTGAREDPKSPHQTLGEEFDKFEINLDQAYLNFQPRGVVPGLTLSVGKFKNPRICYSVYSELLWDADVQPTGGAAVLELADLMSEPPWLKSLRMACGGYVFSEYSGTGDTYIVSPEVSFEVKPADDWSIQAGVEYDYYSDLTPGGSQGSVQENLGNAVIDTNGDAVADEFLSDFDILDASVAVTCNLLPFPVTGSAEYIQNFGAASRSIEHGYALGAAAGRSQKEGDLRGYYQWQVVEQDAVFSLVSQDDFTRTTNFRGHVFGLNYMVADPVGLHAWFLVCRAEDPPAGQSEDWEWRFRFDINARF